MYYQGPPPFAPQIGGGALAIAFFAFVVENLIFQRIMDDPLWGKIWSVVTAWLLVAGLAAYVIGGRYDGFYWEAFAVYMIPAIIVGAFAVHRGLKLREEIELYGPHQGPVDGETARKFD